MRTSDVLGFALSGLWRQKARTAMTLAGVAVGACSLAFSLSLGVGLRDLIDREFKSRPGFWEIEVHPGQKADTAPTPPEILAVDGSFAADRTDRLRAYKEWQYRQQRGGAEPVPLTAKAIADLATIPDVTAVKTVRNLWGYAAAADGRAVNTLTGVADPDEPVLQGRLESGRLPRADENACAASEVLLYELGVRDEAGIAAALGKPITVAFGASGNRGHEFAQAIAAPGTGADAAQMLAASKLLADLPRLLDESHLAPAEKDAVRKLLAPTAAGRTRPPAVRTLPLVGVLRAPEQGKDDSRNGWLFREIHVFLPPAAGEPLVREMQGNDDPRFDRAVVHIRPGSDVPRVVAEIEARGFTTFSSLKWFTNAKREVTLIAAGLNVFALISLFVAALGITNTLVTSVVERTREIGILKAVGMRDGKLLAVFLLEGTFIGVLGGLLGLGLARLAAGPADGLVRKLVEEQANGEKIITESVFEFPPSLMLITVGFAALITTAAALYPARRAGRVPPVEALRHE